MEKPSVLDRELMALNHVKRPAKIACARCLHYYKVFDIQNNRVRLDVFETLRKEPLAREACDWIEHIERHRNSIFDAGENCFFFCPKCYLVIARDIELYE